MKNYHAVALLIGGGLVLVGASGEGQMGLVGLGLVVGFIVFMDLGLFRC